MEMSYEHLKKLRFVKIMAILAILFGLWKFLILLSKFKVAYLKELGLLKILIYESSKSDKN